MGEPPSLMIKKIFETLSDNGLILMIIGFVVALISLLIFMQTRFYGTAVPRIALGCTISGFIIYALGRFFVAAGRHKAKKSERNSHHSEDES